MARLGGDIGFYKKIPAQTRYRTRDDQIFSLTLSRTELPGQFLVGSMRFERMIPAMSRRCHNQLDHEPTRRKPPLSFSKINPSV